jgi:aromatic-L-amino-acid decarboxylase
MPRDGDPDRLNHRLLDRVQQDGRLFLSGTAVQGVACLRAAIVNFRSTEADAQTAVDVVAELGERLEAHPGS